MPNKYLRAKIEERAAKSQMLTSLQDAANAENHRDLTEAENKTFDEITRRLTELDADIARIKEFDEGAAKFAALVGAHDEIAEQAERSRSLARRDAAPETRTAVNFGKRFVESTEFKAYRGTGSSGRVEMPGPASMEFRAAISLGDLDFLPPQQWAGPPGPAERTPFLDVLGRVATAQAAVMYLKWSKASPAKVVPEGQLKPEADLNPVSETLGLETYAHWKAVTRQALEDIAQIQSLVQNKLLRGVRTALEGAAAAALAADTTIPTVTGTAPVPGDARTGLLPAIRIAIATAEAAGYAPNAIVLNPADAADLDVSAMLSAFSGPVRSGSAWGLPVVAAAVIPAGTAFVGDFSQGVTWFDRGVTDVYLSDSHADFFLRNQLVVLAEARAAFAVPEPFALVKVTVAGEEPGGS